MSGVNDRNVESTPLIHANAESDCLGSNSKHCWVVTDEDDAARRGDSSLDDTDNILYTQASEQWPQGEVLESCWRRRELVAKSVVLHVNADEVVQSRCRKAENSRDLLGVEKICGLVPVNPHTTKVVTEQIV